MLVEEMGDQGTKKTKNNKDGNVKEVTDKVVFI